MKRTLRILMLVLTLLAIKAAYSQNSYPVMTGVDRPVKIWNGPQKLVILENGSWVVHCEHYNHVPCAATFLPEQVRESNPWIGPGNTVVAIYDSPENSGTPRYVVVKDPIIEQPTPEGGIELTLYPPSN